jgi:hypothetical protein
MNEWVRQRISVPHERFSNASHWVHQRIPVLRERFSGTLRWVREQILVLREHFHNARRIDQILLITIVLSTLSLPIYFFVPISRLGEISAGIFFCILIVDFLRRERYPALKRWIAETEHGQKMVKIPHTLLRSVPAMKNYQHRRQHGDVFSVYWAGSSPTESSPSGGPFSSLIGCMC